MPMPLPLRTTDAALPLPLHGSTATRALEARAMAALAPHELMARAGLATARLAVALRPHARRVALLCGPGNNGGDGLIAALHLARLGLQVRVSLLADPARLPADAADAWRQACAAGLDIGTDAAGLAGADLVIDALLGLGAARAPSGAIAAAIDAVGRGTAPVLAIDLPSGLHADRGTLYGDRAVTATWTLSLLTLKPGLFTAQGRDRAGEVWFDPLVVAPPPEAPPQAWLGAASRPPPGAFRARRHGQHKGSFGDLLVVGGAPGMAGAAELAARAALAAGAGRVWLSPLDAQAAAASPTPELMLRHRAWDADPALLRRATVVCGCGGGTAVAQALPGVLEHAGRLVLDADGLNAVSADGALRGRLRARSARGQATVATPHPLEAARLLGCSADQVQADRLEAAQRLADELGTVVLLKGSGTVVAAPGRVPWINGSGNARLAAPGSGDVLAGWIGGLWSGLGSDAEAPWLACCGAAWLHGRAADLACAGDPPLLPLRAADLIEHMAQALA